MGAPWNGPNSRALAKIGETLDYQRSKGWELVRLDFGGNVGTAMPNFILYNKFTGILRVFAWLNASQTYTQAIMTMASVAGSQGNAQVSSVSGLSQPLLRAADKYQARNLGDDLTTYICDFGGSQGWVMGEFNMLFDPNHTDPKYYESKLEFKIYGIVKSTVKLGGDFRFTTQPSEGFGFSGPASQIDNNSGSGPKSFIATGTKFLGKFSKFSDQIELLHKKADETANGLGTVKGPLLNIKNISQSIARITGKEATGLFGSLKGLLGVASQASALFGLAGTIVGTLWPSDESSAAAPPSPMVSSGSITLSGSIETSTLLGQAIYVQVPGTPHNFNPSTNFFVRSSQPYYDCPMGLFTLRRTPQLAQVVYPRAIRTTGPRGQVPEQSYTSYKVTQDLQPVFNQLAGIEVVSVKAAIVQKVRPTSLSSLWPATGYNLLYAQVAAGNLEAIPFDAGPTSSAADDTYLVQTPFVDVSCFKNMAFNAPTDSLAKYPAFIRVAAVLRRANSPDAAPIYFTQDYAFDATSVAAPTQQNATYLTINAYPPFMSGFVGPDFDPLDLTFSGTVFQQYGQQFVAPSSLTFDASSSLTMDLVRNGGSQGYGGGYGSFEAGTSINFQGLLAIPEEMEVSMTTDRLALFTCTTPSIVAQAAGTCAGYNPWATTSRPTASSGTGTGLSGTVAASTEHSGPALVRLAPNPASHHTTVQLLGLDAQSTGIARVQILGLSGRLLRDIVPAIKAAGALDVPLQGLATGMYLVRVTATNGSAYTAKLLVD